jgi:hypothetical protein
MLKDLIVEEIRATRLKIEAECDGDFAKITARAMKIQEQYKDRVVSDPVAWAKEHTQPVIPLPTI